MAASTPTAQPVPSFVERLGPIVERLIRLGVPMGPNVLMTVRGRRSGTPRTVPVAVLKVDGRQFTFGAFANVTWVGNLRAAGTATLRRGRHERAVRAVELTPEEAAPFLEAGVRASLRIPVMGPMVAGWYGIKRSSTSADYAAAAQRHPAFELIDDS